MKRNVGLADLGAAILMFSDVKINKKRTKHRFGYLPKDAKRKGLIVCECLTCRKLLIREKRNSLAKHQCSVVDGNLKRCFRCKAWKDLSLFNKSPNLSGGVSKMCRECHNSHPSVIRAEKLRLIRKKRAFDEDKDYYFKSRAYYLKNNANRKHIPHNLDWKYLKKIWGKQNGLCYYTKLSMTSGKKYNFQRWDAASLDRKIPSLGYVKGNVVWCIFGVNSFKNSLTERQFLRKLSIIEWITKKSLTS